MADERCVFGFPDFWSKAYAEFPSAFDAAHRHVKLASDMLNVAHHGLSSKEAAVQYMLASLTTTGMLELLILAGNGAGVGAIKIARGMFETAVIAEYLRTRPHEADDYAEYRHVILWARLMDYPNAPTPKRAKEIEANFNRVRSRFEDKKRKVRARWNQHPISYMANKIGRKEQYDKVYKIAASMHHGNSEAFLSHGERLPNGTIRIVFDDLPSLKWVGQALVSGHVYLLQALQTLNEFMKLGFEKQIDGAHQEFQEVWKQSACS